jgi:putative glutamine amidotransferase
MNERPQILVLENSANCSRLVRRAGGRPVTVGPSDYADVIDILDEGAVVGVLLSGGGDVDPRLYGQKPNKKVYGVSEARDATEMLVLDHAWENDLPVMGICRGSQIMNVYAGGTLKQHRGGHYGWHPVTTTGLLRGVVGSRVSSVRSLHHQHINRPAEGFEIVARADDGTPEAIASDDGMWLGVQFHPEYMPTTRHARRLFRWLVTTSATRAGMEVPAEVAPAKPHRIEQNRKSVQDYKLSWFCPHCRIEFDLQADHEDHMDLFHPVLAEVPGS